MPFTDPWALRWDRTALYILPIPRKEKSGESCTKDRKRILGKRSWRKWRSERNWLTSARPKKKRTTCTKKLSRASKKYFLFTAPLFTKKTEKSPREVSRR